jgi:hypothetical protein
MNAYNLITGGIHASSGTFSDYWELAKLINQRYGNLPYAIDAVRQRLHEDIDRMQALKIPMDQKSAFEYLLARDLARLDVELDQLPTPLEFEARLHNAYKVTLQTLRGLGLEFSEPSFRIVERFPEPYHEMDWVAFAPDKADQENFGIEPGVYLLEGELSPYYSELTLTHELVHAVIGIANPYLLGRGLEEGIAELVGTLYIGLQLYSPRIVYNVFKHTRLGSRSSQSNTLYLDYTRQAFLIYRHFGLNGIAQLIQKGREAIKEIEALCLSDNIDAISLATGNWNEQLTRLGEKLLLGFIPNLVVSPLAAYIAEFVNPERTVEEIAIAARVDIDSAQEALEELQHRTFTILLDKGKITYSDLSFITRTDSFRYEVIL